MRKLSLFLIWTITSLLQPIFCGSAGVRNGSMSGRVVDASRNGLAGFNILIQRLDEPPIIRSTVTDAEGRWQMGQLPVGSYSVQPHRSGFAVGSTPVLSGTAPGSQKAYIESGAHYKVPDFKMISKGASGDAPSTIRLVDALTGETISQANVTVGNFATEPTAAGEYQAVIPISASNSAHPVPVQISAPGYNKLEAEFLPVPGHSISQTYEVEPKKSQVQGQIDPSDLPGVDLSETSIRIDNIPFHKLNAQIDSNGSFSIEVPASTSKRPRTFAITFYLRGFHPMRISAVVAPEAGAVTIARPVVLSPKTVAIQGQISTSTGRTQPSGFNQAFIPELGLSASVSFGRYSFPAVPVALPLTVQIFARNSEGLDEEGSLSFRATQNGGAFHLPTISTNPTGGGSE